MLNYIRNILVPVSFSEASLNAVQSATEMCKRHNAQLHLLHVKEPEAVLPNAGMQGPGVVIATEISAAHQTHLANLADSISRNHGIVCKSYNEVGLIPQCVCSLAEDLSCDVIVTGIDPRPRALFWLDSIPYSIFKRANCPVLTIPNKVKVKFFKKIIFPIRPVVNATEKYHFIRSIINKNKSSVRIMGALNKKDSRQYQFVKDMMGDVKRKLDIDNVPYYCEVMMSEDITDTITGVGKNIAADLIVITASSGRNLKQYFYGNFTQNMINNMHVPVLCIKPKKTFNQESVQPAAPWQNMAIG